MARLRVVKVNEYQFLLCLRHALWGSKNAKFKDWQVGDYLVFLVDKAVAALAEVSGEAFYSEKLVWENGTYPHRVPLTFKWALSGEDRIPVLGTIRDALTLAWGPSYGWGILNQQLLTDDCAQAILDEIRSRPNSLEKMTSTVEALLKNEVPVENAGTGKPPEHETSVVEGDKPATTREDSDHTRAQALLIRLGRKTGCSVWVATNDKSRLFHGKPLGADCIESLPNLGLNPEATDRICRIDVLWLKHNAPVCAFEVESTTSVYSGLLRMSDLLSLVPTLKLELYVVAQKLRRDKVMAELGRPTFRKIGLSEFCRFVALEDLEALAAQLEPFPVGTVLPRIIDTVAVRTDDVESMP